MAERIPAGLTAAEGRKFGLTVGLAFVALGGVALWRGRHLTSTVLLTLGGLLVGAALVVPTMLGPVERAWMALAHMISRVTTPIFMAVVYFIVITPVGYVRRLAGGGIADKHDHNASRWHPHADAADPVERMQRQF